MASNAKTAMTTAKISSAKAGVSNADSNPMPITGRETTGGERNAEPAQQPAKEELESAKMNTSAAPMLIVTAARIATRRPI